MVHLVRTWHVSKQRLVPLRYRCISAANVAQQNPIHVIICIYNMQTYANMGILDNILSLAKHKQFVLSTSIIVIVPL